MRLVKQYYVGWVGVETGGMCINASSVFPTSKAGGQLVDARATMREVETLHRDMSRNHNPEEVKEVLEYLVSLYKV